jgi:hypothetical protein
MSPTVSLPGAACGDCLDCLTCHARTVIRWRGDRDFSGTGGRDIRTFPLYHHELLDWQEGPTSLLWRLRFDTENREFLDEMRDAATTIAAPTLLEESSEFIYEKPSWYTGDDPPAGLGGYYARRWTARVRDLDAGAVDNVLQLGPVRDGVLYAVEAGYAYRHTLSSFNSWVSADGDPVAFGFNEDWNAAGAGLISSAYYPSDPTVDVPLAIDIGCIRCARSQAVATWPVQRPTIIIYDELFNEDGSRLTPTKDQLNATYGAWYRSTAPEEFDVTYNGESITVPGVRHEHENNAHECESIDDPVIHSLTWAGDTSDADKAADCPPVAVCWTHGGSDWAGRYSSGLYGPIDLEAIWSSYESSRPSTVPHVGWWQGWADDTLQPIGSSDLTGVRAIALDGSIMGGLNAAGTLPASISELASWASTGSAKVLAVALPYACTITGGGVPTASDNGLLAALGSSLSLTDPGFTWTYLAPTDDIAIVATPESVIGAGVSARTLPVDRTFDTLTPSQWPLAVAGGTPFERCYVTGQYSGFTQTSTTWVSGAYETLANGSIVLVYGQYFLDTTTAGDADDSQFLPAYFWNALESIL